MAIDGASNDETPQDMNEGDEGKEVAALPSSVTKRNSTASEMVSSAFDDADDDTDDSSAISSLKEPLLRGSQRLAVDKNAVSWALFSLRIGVIADSVSSAILTPNYPFLVIPGQFEDSFPSVEPFGFSAATYFLPMTAMLGAAASGTFVGSLSDRIGRRKCILVCVGGSVIGCLLKYVARKSFWAFCALNFVNGLFGATLPVALAYVSDIHPNRDKKNDEIGKLIGASMLGVSGGGIIAILMQDVGLFTPLFVGAGLNFLATIMIYVFLLEPDANFHFEEETTDEDRKGPPVLKKGLMSVILGGAVLDNIGSSGLFPLALSPLMFVQFYESFVLRGDVPIMSATAYKWITMLLALMVIPGAIMSGPVFKRIGAPAACVFGNVVTAVGITAVLLIALIEPATSATFGGFLAVLYTIMPFTVLSNLSTGPMLDMIAPVNKRGLVQGINTTTMNLARSVSPFALGAYADAVGTDVCMWTCVGVSLLAAVANVPLIFAKQLKPRKKRDYTKAFEFEDEDLVLHIKEGHWVPPKQLAKFHNERYAKGVSFITPAVKKYSEDKQCLAFYKKQALEDFRFTRWQQSEYLSYLDTPEHRREVAEKLSKVAPSKNDQEKTAADLGAWFGDYMFDSGYFLDGGRITLMKQMIVEAFPPINKDGELNEENMEMTTLRYMRLINDYFERTQSGPAVEAFAKAYVTE
ncbi:MAG: hypothetical protein SGILL_007899 [Bacillariaceae sp.]